MEYLLRADEEFKGHAQSMILPDGTVAYTDGLSPEQYAKERGFPVRIVHSAELDQLINDFNESMKSEPVEITKDAWWYALEVLPPCKWKTVRGVELFHVSERLTSNLVSWYGRIGENYYTCTQADAIDLELLAEKFAKAEYMET